MIYFKAPYKTLELKHERDGAGNSQKNKYAFYFTDQRPIVLQEGNKLILTMVGEWENQDFVHLIKEINKKEVTK